MNIHNKPFLIIYGPTGVGKTALTEKLAHQIPAEIINMDIGQLYTPLSIGTAKPEWRTSSIPHHGFDILDKPINYTVTQYRELLQKLLNQVWQRGNLPIVVGGSGFYLKSLFFPPAQAIEISDAHLDQEISWQKLHDIDPERAAAIHPHDTYRIQRALAIWYTTGIKPSVYKPVFDPIGNAIVVCITRDRAQLYKQINERTEVMMREGWIEEAKKLKKTPWESFLHEKHLIGYDDILTYLDSKQTPTDYARLIAAIQQKTRQYAKRQMTFWRMLTRSLRPYLKHDKVIRLLEANISKQSVDAYVTQIVSLISGAKNGK